MEYRIETDYNQYDLENKIRELIKAGWQPQGGVSFVYHSSHKETWAQAMVKGNN